MKDCSHPQEDLLIAKASYYLDLLVEDPSQESCMLLRVIFLQCYYLSIIGLILFVNVVELFLMEKLAQRNQRRHYGIKYSLLKPTFHD